MIVPLTPLDFRLRAAQLYPSKIGIVDGDRRFTYGEYDDRVNRLAGQLGASLRYSHIEEIMASGLQAYLADIEHQCIGAYESVYETYIAYPIDRALAP